MSNLNREGCDSYDSQPSLFIFDDEKEYSHRKITLEKFTITAGIF